MRRAATANRGIALVLVLWVVVLLSTMAVGMVTTQRSELSVVRNLIDRSQAMQLAEAAIYYGIAQALAYRRGQEDVGWKPDGQTRTWRFADTDIKVSVADEMSRISINEITPEMLSQLLESSGIAEEERDAVRDAILDWRDKDNVHRLSGAEDDDYEAAGLDYGARDDDFETVAELRQVLGVTDEIYRKLAPVFTVHTRSAKVHAESASSQVLGALPGITPEIIYGYLETRREYAEQGLDAPPLPGVSREFLGGGNSGMFRIAAWLEQGDVKLRLEAVVKRGGAQGYTILEWITDPVEPMQLALEPAPE